VRIFSLSLSNLIHSILETIMARLIIIEKGLGVVFPNNEHNIETVFSLDSSNQPIQLFTYDCCYKLMSPIDLEKAITSADRFVTIDKGYLFYSFRYQISYMHNMMQTVSLLNDYLTNYKDYKLLIPRHHYSELYKDILCLIGIQTENIIFLETNHIYNVKEFAERLRWHENALEVTDAVIQTFGRIRNALSISPNLNPTRKIYLQRDGVPNSLFSNSETGIIRKILNEDALIETLKTNGFEIVTLGDKYFHEKKRLLENANIIIAPLGANCLNLVFTNLPRHLILLSNSSPLGENTFKKLLSTFNNTSFFYKHFLYQNDPNHTDPLNQWNSSYTVNIQEIMDAIKEY